MSEVTGEQKFRWVIQFTETDVKLYPYINRTVSEMEGRVVESFRKHGRWPYRIWAVVDGEMIKVNINVPEVVRE